ncbi:MAG: hypothetical protein QOF18_3012, partial [Frankiaceae bacterium]|nr:hypothetical protein [Frankiaceae bacterium]
MELRGAVVVVTGAGRGIGAATARALAARGAQVVVTGLDEAELAATAASIGAVPIVADVRDPAHAERVLAATAARFGPVDVVVANAGIGYAGAFAEMPAERIDDVIAVNVLGPMLLARSAVPAMLQRHRGALVFVS